MRRNLRGTEWVLRYKDSDKEVESGDLVVDSHDMIWDVTGGTPPHKPSSTGRVYVVSNNAHRHSRQFFPTVFDLEWVVVPS